MNRHLRAFCRNQDRKQASMKKNTKKYAPYALHQSTHMKLITVTVPGEVLQKNSVQGLFKVTKSEFDHKQDLKSR